jgi:hypothetical protein
MSERVVLHFDDGTKIDFNNEADALNHVKVQGGAGVTGLHEEGTPEELAIANLEAQLKALKSGKETATGDPYNPGVELKPGKQLKTRKQLDAAVADLVKSEQEEGS